MKKSERLIRRLADKRKINFKYFLLAHILTLFFVVAPASPAGGPIALAADLSAEEADNLFDFNQKNAYSEPFSKLIEFLNSKKNELEKYNGDFSGAQSLFRNNNFNNIKFAGESDSINSSFLSAVFESVKSFIVDKPSLYFGTVIDSAKSFIFPGTNQNDFEYKSSSEEEMAREIEVLKQQYAEAIDETNAISQKFNLLQSELGKIKNSGAVVGQPAEEQRDAENTIKILERIVSNLPGGQAGALGLSQSDLDSKISEIRTELNNLNANLSDQINSLSSNTNRQTASAFQAISLTNRIDNLSGTRLSNITVSGVSGLADSDIPDGITVSNYLPLSGGTLTGLATFSNASTTVLSATNLCLSTDCRASWPASGGSGGGTWSTTTVAGILVNYPNNNSDVVAIGSNSTTTAKYWFNPNTLTSYLGGNVGLGTTSPNWTLSVAGIGSVDDYVRAGYFTATSTSATSTFPYLRVSTNSNLGTVIGGTWNGTAIGDSYLTKTGDWTGTLDTYNGSDLLARANHTGTQNLSTISNYDWVFSNNYGTSNLTASSSSIALWARGGINASSTSNFVYASSTALSVSGNSYLGTVSSGTWAGTVITSSFLPAAVANGVTTGVATFTANDFDSSAALISIDYTNGQAASGSAKGFLTSIDWTTFNNKWDLASSTIPVNKGGTGQTSFGQGWLHSDGTTFTSSTSPTVAYLTATSTTATSTFATGGLTVGTSQLVVQQNSGNVGIGTTTPFANTLTVTNKAIYNNNPGLDILVYMDSGQGSYGLIQAANAANTSTRNLALQSWGGNVGIGTTTPNWKTQIAGTRPFLTLSDTSAGLNDKHWFMTSQGGNFYIGTSTDALNATSTYLTINNKGYVGIGTTSPFDLLSVEKNQNAPTNITLRNTTAGTNSYTQINNFNDLGNNAALGLSSSLYSYGVNTANTAYLYGDGSGGVAIGADNASGVIKFATGVGILEKMRLSNAGNLGIGTTSPYAKLTVWGGGTGTNTTFEIANSASTTLISVLDNGTITLGTATAGDIIFDTSATGNVVRVGMGTTTPDADFNLVSNQTAANTYLFTIATTTGNVINRRFIVDSDGDVHYDGSLVNSADYAESFTVVGDKSDYEPGDIIVLSTTTPGKVKKSEQPYESRLVGVYSTKPGIIGSLAPDITDYEIGKTNDIPVGLLGRVPVKVSLEGGVIQTGDKITSSSLSGIGMKATSSGAVIGIALEPFNGEVDGKVLVLLSQREDKLNLPENELKEEVKKLKLEIENIKLAGSGQSNNDGIISSGFNWVLEQFKNIGLVIESGILSVREIVSEKITAKKICIEDVCVDKNQLKELLQKNGISDVSAAINTSSPNNSSSTASYQVGSSSNSSSAGNSSQAIEIVQSSSASSDSSNLEAELPSSSSSDSAVAN